MSQKCECGRWAKQDSSYCFWCDPATPKSDKQAAWSAGGRNSRKIFHNLKPGDYRPLTIESLKRLYEDLIEASIEGHRDDLVALIKDLSRILPRASELVAYENMTFLAERLERLEQRRNGKLLLGVNNDADIIEHSQPD